MRGDGFIFSRLFCRVISFKNGQASSTVPTGMVKIYRLASMCYAALEER